MLDTQPDDSIVSKAIEAAGRAVRSYCKFLSANDSGETGGHQAGILVSRRAFPMLFADVSSLSHIEKRQVRIRWQEEIETDSIFTYYESKGELRITSFGRGFPFLNKEDTGALFVLCEVARDFYLAYFLYTDDDINAFLEAFGLSPTETNKMIERQVSLSEQEERAIRRFILSLGCEFPPSEVMSAQARAIEQAVYDHVEYARSNPDRKLIDWTDAEYRLFRAIEQYRYGDLIRQGFCSMDEFVELANRILNRRKSRAGKGLEHHIAAIFDANDVKYEAQVITEGNKKPDFIFPSGRAYHDFSFPADRLVSLASKTTCKDRWRQVINEADRLRGRDKFLLTLQQGITSSQMQEMEQERVVLVVPKPYISCYPREQQGKIWTVKKFIDYLREIERFS